MHYTKFALIAGEYSYPLHPRLGIRALNLSYGAGAQVSGSRA